MIFFLYIYVASFSITFSSCSCRLFLLLILRLSVHLLVYFTSSSSSSSSSSSLSSSLSSPFSSCPSCSSYSCSPKFRLFWSADLSLLSTSQLSSSSTWKYRIGSQNLKMSGLKIHLFHIFFNICCWSLCIWKSVRLYGENYQLGWSDDDQKELA